MKEEYEPWKHKFSDMLTQADLDDIKQFDCLIVPYGGKTNSKIIPIEEVFNSNKKRRIVKTFDPFSSSDEVNDDGDSLKVKNNLKDDPSLAYAPRCTSEVIQICPNEPYIKLNGLTIHKIFVENKGCISLPHGEKYYRFCAICGHILLGFHDKL